MSVGVAERIEEHVIEQELRTPAPRKLRMTYWSSVSFIACAVGLLAVGFSVSCIAIQSARMLWLSEHGKIVVAQVTGCTFLDGNTGACTLHPTSINRVEYAFNLNGHHYTGSTVYDGHPLTVGPVSTTPTYKPIDVRYGWSWGAFSYSPARSLSYDSARTALVAAFLISLLCAFPASRWVLWNARVRRFARAGNPIIGTVKEKTITDDDGPRYYVWVGLLDSDNIPYEFREPCTPDQWRRLELGQPITVLAVGSTKRSFAIYTHLPMRCV